MGHLLFLEAYNSTQIECLVLSLADFLLLIFNENIPFLIKPLPSVWNTDIGMQISRPKHALFFPTFQSSVFIPVCLLAMMFGGKLGLVQIKNWIQEISKDSQYHEMLIKAACLLISNKQMHMNDEEQTVLAL